jgi:hypothetical protein
MIETCCGTYDRTRSGFEKLLEEWVIHYFDSRNNSVELGWNPLKEFEDYKESWLQRARKKLSRKGYGINKHTVFRFNMGVEVSDGMKDNFLE